MAEAMIACADERAAQIGLDVLAAGGNAIDAGIATAAALNVVDFASTGIGGDMFALVWMRREGTVHALNASGCAPALATIEAFRERGLDAIPERGPLAVTVPGALDGWQRLLERFGTMALATLLEPATELAESGHAVTARMAGVLSECVDDLKACPAAAAIFLPGGEAPKAGDTLTQSDLAHTFRAIARDGIESFYRGALGKTIESAFEDAGAFLRCGDLAVHTSDWVRPLAASYRGHTIYEMPPNSQGLALLQQMRFLEGYDLSALSEAKRTCLQVEAKRIAFADRARYLTDPNFETVPVAQLLSDAYAYERRSTLNLAHVAHNVPHGVFAEPAKDTTYLAVVDRQGNCLSFINSLFANMGSCFVAPGTGILFQCRGCGFSLNPDHANRLVPGKRTMHTLNPLMVFRDDQPYLVMGTIGGDQQTAGTQQILVNHLDLAMPLADAVAAPRWCSGEGVTLHLEKGMTQELAPALSVKGYDIHFPGDAYFGGAQAIRIDPASGELTGASDHRVGGKALGL